MSEFTKKKHASYENRVTAVYGARGGFTPLAFALLAVLVVVVGSLTGYFAAQRIMPPPLSTPLPAEDVGATVPEAREELESMQGEVELRMYRSEVLGFEISLPPGWQEIAAQNDSVTFSDGTTHVKIHAGDDQPISLLLPFEAYTVSNDMYPVYRIIAGEEFIELRWNRLPEGSSATDVYTLTPTNDLPHNGRHYALIAFAAEGKSFDEVSAQAVMTTFRFLSTMADTPNWLTCASNHGFQFSYPPDWKFWKRGAGERFEISCDPTEFYVTLSPSIYSEENIHVGVFNKETQPGTIYAENYASLDEYFALRSAILKTSPIVREFVIDGVRAVQLRRGDVLMYYRGGIIEITREGMDNEIFEAFLSKFGFVQD